MGNITEFFTDKESFQNIPDDIIIPAGLNKVDLGAKRISPMFGGSSSGVTNYGHSVIAVVQKNINNGSLTLSNSNIEAGTYTNATIIVDENGVVTEISNGSGGAGSSLSRVTRTSGNLSIEIGYYGSTAPTLSGSSGSYTITEPTGTIITGFNLSGDNTITNGDGDLQISIVSIDLINHFIVHDLIDKSNNQVQDLSLLAAVQISETNSVNGTVVLTLTSVSGFGATGFRFLARSL